MYSIFINYRREESEGVAGRLREALQRRFGKSAVFFDKMSIAPGEEFWTVIRQSLAACKVVLVLIDRRWATPNADGKNRLAEPDDYVCREITEALATRALVIPVLVEGAPMPPRQALPPELHPLCGRNALPLSDQYWDHDLKRLAAQIEAAGVSRPTRAQRPLERESTPAVTTDGPNHATTSRLPAANATSAGVWAERAAQSRGPRADRGLQESLPATLLIAGPPGKRIEFLVGLRRWLDQGKDEFLHHLRIEVREATDVQLDLAGSEQSLRNTVLVVFAPRLAEPPAPLRKKLRMVRQCLYVTEPSPGRLKSHPLASLLETVTEASTSDPLASVRKALLKYSVARAFEIRDSTDQTWLSQSRRALKESLLQSFQLRYETWELVKRKLRTENQSRLDIDFSDAKALVLAAFNRNTGQLAGCARLVFSLGAGFDAVHKPLIEEIVHESRDPVLSAMWHPPEGMPYPFDVNKGFPTFGDYYGKWLRLNLYAAEVSRVVVREELRGCGIGEVLVDSLVSRALAERLDLLFLACEQKRRGLYERCGFEQIPEVTCESFPGFDVPAISMRRILSERAFALTPKLAPAPTATTPARL